MHGCSNLLADSFIRGAKENGHVVTETDAAHIHITPCTGCKACNFSGQPCRIKDDMTEVKKEILAADITAELLSQHEKVAFRKRLMNWQKKYNVL